jgi:GT2 family glycosyltransferase
VLGCEDHFNESTAINVAVRQARGEVIALLSEGLEVISPDWLAEMVSHAVRPGIGAIGAMLYYPNGTIRHAGVILGVGVAGIAGRAYEGRPRGHAGQMGRALLIQNLAAVSGACLVLRKRIFEEVGGLDGRCLPAAFNVIDFCLRVREKGYRNLWTPYAEFYHHDFAAGVDENAMGEQAESEEIEFMRARWEKLLSEDPAYNPNLALNESFMFAFPPRVKKP